MANDALLFHWAMKDPGADDAQARRLVQELILRTPYAAARGDLDLILASFAGDAARTANYMFYANLSSPISQAWLRDPRVKARIARNGFPAYWRVKGWPALCHAVGSDDFECGVPAGKG